MEGAEDPSLDVREDFSALLAYHTVEAVAAEGSDTCTILGETDSYYNAGALLAHEHEVTSACTYNDIIWTLHMKTGDKITLRQVEECSEKQRRTVSWEDTPMDTTADLQALLDDLTLNLNAETEMVVELPQRDLHGAADHPPRHDAAGSRGRHGVHRPHHGEPYGIQRGHGHPRSAVGPAPLRRGGHDRYRRHRQGPYLPEQLLDHQLGRRRAGFIRNGTALDIRRMPGEWMTYYVHNSTFTDNDTVIAGPLADQVRLEDGNYVQQSA